MLKIFNSPRTRYDPLLVSSGALCGSSATHGRYALALFM
jgi:hypothetical protein